MSTDAFRPVIYSVIWQFILIMSIPTAAQLKAKIYSPPTWRLHPLNVVYYQISTYGWICMSVPQQAHFYDTISNRVQTTTYKLQNTISSFLSCRHLLQSISFSFSVSKIIKHFRFLAFFLLEQRRWCSNRPTKFIINIKYHYYMPSMTMTPSSS